MTSSRPKVQRRCGPCQECCVHLVVEAIKKPEGMRCKHQCATGCAIYDDRPNSCREFTCAWREGLLGPHDRPDKTKHIVWVTQMSSPGGNRLDVVQCNTSVRRRHPKTMRWLRRVSFRMPVLIVEGYTRSELWSFGRKVIEWHGDDFVNLEFEGERIVGGTVRKRRDIIATPEMETAYAAELLGGLSVAETDPDYRRKQIEFIEEQCYR